MLIGISGKARVGKDTLSDFLIKAFHDKFDIDFVKIAYADSLKNKVMHDFNLSWEQLYGDSKEAPDKRYKKNKEGPDEDNNFWTPREILQFIGTECYRSIDDNFWVKNLFKDIDSYGYENVIISDCRFKSEVDAIKERGGYHIKVIRDYDGVVHNNNHSSEKELEDDYDIDVKINNDGSLDMLKDISYQTVDFIMALHDSKNKLI